MKEQKQSIETSNNIIFMFDLYRSERQSSSMTVLMDQSTSVRRPWEEYLKDNRERWIREAG